MGGISASNYRLVFRTVALAFLISGLMLCQTGPANADGLTVNGSPGLDMNTSTVTLNCNDVTIGSGGALDLGSGHLDHCRHFLIASGGTLVDGTGTITICGTFTNNSDFVKNPASAIEFVSGCGVENGVDGTGDTDGDGVSDKVEGLTDRNSDGIPDFLDPAVRGGTAGGLPGILMLLLDD